MKFILYAFGLVAAVVLCVAGYNHFKTPRIGENYVIALDVTQTNLLNTTQAIVRRVEDIASKLTNEDTLQMFLVTAHTQGGTHWLPSYAIPTKKGAYGRGAHEALEKWREKFRSVIDSASSQLAHDLTMQSDIFGALCIAAARRDNKRHNTMILLSDMQEVDTTIRDGARGVNCEQRIPSANLVATLRQKALVPDLNGWTIQAPCAYHAHNISNDYWISLRAWWLTNYFPATGASDIVYEGNIDSGVVEPTSVPPVQTPPVSHAPQKPKQRHQRSFTDADDGITPWRREMRKKMWRIYRSDPHSAVVQRWIDEHDPDFDPATY